MRSLYFAIALASFAIFVGCGDDAQPSTEANTALPECPGGDDDLRSAGFDLGEDPQGVPTARGALERFLEWRKSELTAEAFEQTDDGSGSERKANFSYSRDGVEGLVQVYAERLDSGWLVISYDYCRGIL